VSERSEANVPTGQPNDPEAKTVGSDPSKRWRGGKGAAHRIEERVNCCYAYILEGGTKRQICQKLIDRFNISLPTAFNDYRRAMDYLKEEQTETRAEILNQLQALRLAAANKAIKKGQLMAATTLLSQLGAAVGEGNEYQAAEEIKLSIEIEKEK